MIFAGAPGLYSVSDGSTATYDVAGGIFRGRPRNSARRVAFLMYADSDVPEVALALQDAGQGVILLDDAHGNRVPTTSVISIQLGEGVIADVRIAETLGRPDGVSGPDTTVQRSRGADEPLAAALNMVHRATRPPTPRAVGTVTRFIPRAESAYADMRSPTLPFRLLAVFRFWNAIRFFYPSPMPPGTSWDEQLVTSIRHMESARDSIDYRLGLAALSASLRDGHVQTPWAFSYVVGDAGPHIALLFVEGHPMVTAVAGDSATIASGIRVGDVVVRVDGEDVAQRMARIEKLLPGTSRQGEPNGPPLNRLLFGPRGSSVRVMVERADGTRPELSVPRMTQPCSPVTCSERTGPPLRFLTPEIGYADLARISESMVDSLFETFRNTRAIIFDGRGRNAGSPATIASRLSERRVVGGRAVRPLVTSTDASIRTTVDGSFLLDSVSGSRYRGKTVLLINDRAFSNAEQVPIFFSSANGTTVIGSPTAGGVGGLTFVAAPGGLAMSVPSSEGRLLDGRVIHRVGVPPDILVRPTIAGIRAGRDEVLERALAYLREGSPR